MIRTLGTTSLQHAWLFPDRQYDPMYLHCYMQHTLHCSPAFAGHAVGPDKATVFELMIAHTQETTSLQPPKLCCYMCISDHRIHHPFTHHRMSTKRDTANNRSKCPVASCKNPPAGQEQTPAAHTASQQEPAVPLCACRPQKKCKCRALNSYYHHNARYSVQTICIPPYPLMQ